MEICPSKECTGCNACSNICPKHCITLKENNMGELHPVINHDKCINCNLCIKTCPNNNNLLFNYPLQCYASWITDSIKRKKCASGGIATIMYEYVTNKKKGVIYGTKFDKEFNANLVQGETDSDIDKFKGSKYVQSNIADDLFVKIKKQLKDNIFTLFIGTPCQVAALKSFLVKDYDNLITVDLICHGVTPGKYLKEEINYLRNKNNLNNITDVRFRGNDNNDRYLTLWNNDIILYKTPFSESNYYSAFTYGITLRENCYNCKYSRPDRVSDITIGDFIGLGKKKSFNFSSKNVSSVIINTNKGDKFYNELSCNLKNILMNEKREYEERLDYGPSLRYPFKKHKLRFIFKQLYKITDYYNSIKIVMTILKLKKYFNIR